MKFKAKYEKPKEPVPPHKRREMYSMQTDVKKVIEFADHMVTYRAEQCTAEEKKKNPLIHLDRERIVGEE